MGCLTNIEKFESFRFLTKQPKALGVRTKLNTFNHKFLNRGELAMLLHKER
eukprot:m.110540 g.110540  ORF g.110540 m.110540 type:complete len:51 (+) comp14330_c2_seq2:716-868(+)